MELELGEIAQKCEFQTVVFLNRSWFRFKTRVKKRGVAARRDKRKNLLQDLHGEEAE